MKKITLIILLNIFFIGTISKLSFAANIDKAYEQYDFISGEKTIFEDNFTEKKLTNWALQGGKAKIINYNDEKCLSIDEYYTKLKPILFLGKKLPDTFSIEYDTWLDHGYDGNPGVEIHLAKGDSEIIITPNKHDLSVSFPNDGKALKENPPEYFGENKFYDRWVHISIAFSKKHLKVYLDQYKMIDIPDSRLNPTDILVTGNNSQNMKILLKNFRIATGFPSKILFEKGKFITRGIKFDVNKAVLKPESITVIKEIYKYLVQNSNIKLEIDGHTDSDGSDDFNLKLSQQRADAVKNQLVSMGINESRLKTKGFGESNPIDKKNTPEAKAINRRVEFLIK